MRSQRRRAGCDQAADTYVTQGVGPIGGTSFEGGVDPVQHRRACLVVVAGWKRTTRRPLSISLRFG